MTSSRALRVTEMACPGLPVPAAAVVADDSLILVVDPESDRHAEARAVLIAMLPPEYWAHFERD